MCNCGKKGGDAARVPASATGMRRVMFEYVGATALTVFGPSSGRRYRFERPGAQVAVDPLDLAALRTVPQLRHRASA
jgi:hypothetical protein